MFKYEGKPVTLAQIEEVAKASNMTVEDYINKAGIVTKGKKQPTPQQGAETVGVIEAPDTVSKLDDGSLEYTDKESYKKFYKSGSKFTPYAGQESGAGAELRQSPAGGFEPLALEEVVVTGEDKTDIGKQKQKKQEAFDRQFRINQISAATKIPEFGVSVSAGLAATTTDIVGGLLNFVDKYGVVPMNYAIGSYLGYDTTLEAEARDSAGNLQALNEVSDFLRQYQIKKYDEKGNEQDILSLIEQDNYADAAELAFSEGFSAAPYLALSIAAPGAGSALIGMSVTGQEVETALKERPDATLAEIYGASALKGGVEFVTNMFGGGYQRGILNISKKLGIGTTAYKKAVDIYTKTFLGKLADSGIGLTKSAATNFIEEASASLGSTFVDEQVYNDNIEWKSAFRQSINEGLIGAALGAPVGSAGGFNSIATKQQALEFLAPKKWTADLAKQSRRLAEAKFDLEKAPDSRKEQFKKKVQKTEYLIKEKKKQLQNSFDSLTKKEKIQYANNLSQADKALGIIGNNKYSFSEQTDAQQELTEANNQNQKLVGDGLFDAVAEKAIGKVLKNSERLAEAAEKAKGINRKDLKIKYLKEAVSGEDAIFLRTEEGQTTIFVNTPIAEQTGQTNVLGHELLHYMINNKFKTDNESMRPLVDSFKEYLKETQPELYNRVQERIDLNYTEENAAGQRVIKEGALEEYFNVFSDLVAKEKIVVNESLADKIKNSSTRFLNGLGFGSVKLETGKDVFNFIRNYQKNISNFKFKQLGVDIKSSKIPQQVNDEVAKSSLSGEAIQKIYDEQGVAGAMDIIDAYKPLTSKITRKYQNVPGYDFELLQSEIELGKRGLLDLIQAYTPDKGATLNTYIQGQLTRRAIEAANRILDTEFTEDVTEAKGVTDTTTEEVTERVEDKKPKEKVSLRKQLGLDETIKPTVVNAVKKTFGTKLPEVTSSKFRPELEKSFRTELKKPLAKLMGRTEDYRSFLSNNFEAIYEAIPQYVINRRFNAFAEVVVDANGKPLREKTAEGKKIFTKKKIVKAEWLKYFLGDDVGRSTQGTRKTALAEALAEQFAYDATMEVLADPDVVEKIKGISELTGQKFVDNYLDEVSKAIERPTTFKFSLSTKIESDWVADPLNPLSGDKKYNFTVGKAEFESKVFNEPDFEYEIFEGTFGIEDGTLADDPKSVLLAFADKETGSTEILGTATQGLTSAFQVFGTVANSTIDLVKKEKLNSVAFTAKEKSRIRLYNALANKFAKELGWEYYAFPLNEGETGFIVYDPKILKEAEETNISKDVLKFSKSEIFDIEGNKVIIKDKLEDIFNISAKAANFNVKTPFNKLEKEFLKYTNNNFKLADETPYDAKVYRSILFEYYVGKLVEFYNPNIKLANSFNGFSSAGIGDLTFESKKTGEKIYAEIKMIGRAGIYPQMGGGGISVDLKKGEISEAEKGKKIPMFNYIKEALNKDGYSKTLIDILNKIGVKNIGKFTKEQVKEFDKIINKSKKEGKGNPLLKNINLGNTDNIVKGYAEQGVDIIISGNDVSNIVIHSLNNKNFGLDIPALKGEGVATVRFTWASKSKGNATIRVINNIKGKTINKGASLQEIEQIKFSKSLSREFNEVLQKSTGVEWYKTYSPVKARLAGKGKGRKFFIPYSADDFVGLLYATLGRNKVGDQQMAWYEENLLRPFSRGIQRYEAAKQKALRDWMMLKKQIVKDVPGGLNKTNDSGFTNQTSVRVYIWNKQGMEIPNMSKKDLNENLKIIRNNPKLKEFANRLIALNPDGYPEPSNNWDSGDITTDLVSYINDVRRGEFLTEWKENVEQIFSEDNKNKLRALYGDRYVEALDDMLHRMKTGRNRKFGVSKIERNFMDWTNNSVGAIMFFNARSAVLQTLSSVNFINFSDNNPINAGIAFANQKQYWKDFSTLFNSDFLKQRRSGLQTDINADEIANAASNSKNKAKAALSAILKFGFTPTQIADSFAIASGGATMYRNRIKKYLKEGLDQEAAEKRAFTDFQEIAEETQQSARPDRISMQQASSLGRLILAFGNTPMQYARLTKKATLDLINRRGDWKTNISKIAYYSVIQNIIFSALQQGLFALLFDEEDDDKEKERYFRIANSSFDTLLRGTGVYGAAAATVKNMIMEIIDQSKKSRPDYTQVAIEATQISPPINSKLRKLESAGKTFTYKQSKEKVFTEGFSLENPAFLAAGRVISAGTNLPADRVVQKADHIYTAMQPETELWQAIGLSLGWSEWDLGMIEKQTNSSFKKVPLKKTKLKTQKLKRTKLNTNE